MMFNRVTENLFLLLFGMLIGTTVFTVQNVARVQASTHRPPDVVISDNCAEEASIGDIKFYFCDGDLGPDFVANNYGLMWPIN